MDNKKEIELYDADRIQEVIGYVPNYLVRWGVYIIAFFITVLLTGSYFFHYPETLKGNIIIPCNNDSLLVRGVLFLPPTNVGEISEGAKVLVFSDIYPEAKYGFLEGVVEYVNGTPDASGRYSVSVMFPNGRLTNRGIKLSSKLQLNGKGEVIIKKYRLIEVLITPFQMITNLTDKNT